VLQKLEQKLKKHNNFSVKKVLKKVLEDVQKVMTAREYQKDKKREYRADKQKSVHMDVHIPVHMDSNNREDKIRLDKNIKNTPPTPRKRGMVYADDFLTFWKTYPKKVGKDAAWRAWKGRTGTRPPLAELVSAIERQAQSDQWQKENGQFIPNPATWLNQGRWADEVGEESSIDAWARKKQAEMEASGGTV
jgi:hypothetical protein